jgi:hypothetical protein
VTAELVIITPEVVPGSGGVADHTLALLRQWRLTRDATVLAATSGALPTGSAPNVKPLARSHREIAGQLPANAGKVFVQYSAYGYDRLGYPRELIRALIEWKRRAGRHLVVMFHEIWTFWSFTNKNFFLQQLHRRALKQLLQVCDIAFTSTASQAEHLCWLCPQASVQILPVGSNIRPNQLGKLAREPGCAVLFGLQLSRIRTLEKMRNSLSALADSGQIKRIICLGQNSNPEASAHERELLSPLNLSQGFVQQSGAAEEMVSRALSTAAFGLFGQDALSCTKSGSFMAYAAHQLNVLADFASPSEPPPICWLVAPLELLNGIDRAELDRRAECLRIWQEQNCSWDVIGARLGRALAIEAEPETA